MVLWQAELKSLIRLLFKSACLIRISGQVLETGSRTDFLGYNELPIRLPIDYETVRDCASALYWRALIDLPEDVKARLRAARDDESDPGARSVIESMMENSEIAGAEGELICQDTGFPVFFVEMGRDCSLGFDLEEALSDGVAMATREHLLRANCVDVLNRENTGNNRGEGYPMVHLTAGEGSSLNVTLLAKGSGSESRSRMAMVDPVEGWAGIRRYILETVALGAAKSCPPVVVGVGIGGSFDSVALLSKRALTRPLGVSNREPRLASLERGLLKSINELGIGPMGLGGNSTALWVSLEREDTHITCSPVSVNLSCWAHRRAAARIDEGGFEVMG